MGVAPQRLQVLRGPAAAAAAESFGSEYGIRCGAKGKLANNTYIYMIYIYIYIYIYTHMIHIYIHMIIYKYHIYHIYHI